MMGGMMRRVLLSIALALALAVPALAQQSILQGGAWNSGHVPMYGASGGSQPFVQDSGTAAGGVVGTGVSDFGITARGTGTAPFLNAGTGPFGTNFCIYDGPTTPTGYHYLCFGANSTSSGSNGALIATGAVGGAAAQPLNMNINGTNYQFPFTLSGVVGPASSTLNDLACWNNTQGSLLKDCGAFPVTSGTQNQLAWFAATGTVVSGLPTANSGVLITSAGGVPSISSTLPSAMTIPSPTMTGTVTGGTYSGATLASPTLTGTVAGANTIPYSILAQAGANTQLCNTTGSTANLTASAACNNQAGSGTGTFLPTGVIYSAFTPVGNGADTTEDVLQSFTLPAASLATNGKALRVRLSGTTAANADTKVSQIYFGATNITLFNGAVNGVLWYSDFTVVRTSATTQDMFQFGGQALSIGYGHATPTETLANAIVVKVTGRNSSNPTANSVVCNWMLVEVLN